MLRDAVVAAEGEDEGIRIRRAGIPRDPGQLEAQGFQAPQGALGLGEIVEVGLELGDPGWIEERQGRQMHGLGSFSLPRRGR